MDVSTPQGPELQLDLSGQKEPVLTLKMSTPQGPELHLEVSEKQKPVLVWTLLSHRGLNYAWMCQENRSLCWSGHYYPTGAWTTLGCVWEPVPVWTCPHHTTEAFTAPGHVYTTGAWAAPGSVCKTGALKCVPWGVYKILHMEIIMEFREILSKYATKNSAKFRGTLGNFSRNTEVTEVNETDGILCWRNPVDTLAAGSGH